MAEETTETESTEESQDASQPEVDIDSARESAVNEFLQTLGVDSTEHLQEIVKAKNDSDKANQTDLENTKSDLDKANGNNAELSKQVEALQATNAVLKAGVIADHVDDATILAQAKVSSGKVKSFDKAIAEVLKSNPQFKGAAQTGADGTAITDSNTSGGNGSLTKEEFDKMSYNERLKVFSEQPEKYKEFTKL